MTDYNFSSLDSHSQRTLAKILLGFYAGAMWFAKDTGLPLDYAELQFSRLASETANDFPEEEITKMIGAIDSGEIGIFSSDLSMKLRTLEAKVGLDRSMKPKSEEDFEDDDESDEWGEEWLPRGIEDKDE